MFSFTFGMSRNDCLGGGVRKGKETGNVDIQALKCIASLLRRVLPRCQPSQCGCTCLNSAEYYAVRLLMCYISQNSCKTFPSERTRLYTDVRGSGHCVGHPAFQELSKQLTNICARREVSVGNTSQVQWLSLPAPLEKC